MALRPIEIVGVVVIAGLHVRHGRRVAERLSKLRRFVDETGLDLASGTRARTEVRSANTATARSSATTTARSATPWPGVSAGSSPPAAATISGDGVSPAARAAASGSPPGNAADTASADAGRRAGSRRDSAGSRARPPDRSSSRSRRRRRRRPLRAGSTRSASVLRVERALAGEELVEDQAERVDVARGRHLLPLQLLGRHVGGRARADVAPTAPTAARPKSITRTWPAPSSMTFAGFRSRCSTPRSCAAARPAHSCRAMLERLVFGQASDAAQRRGEILAVDVLHREEELAVDFADVVHAADVRMRHLARRAHFVVELREPRRDRAASWPAETSARPAGRAAGHRPDRPRPSRRGRADR